MSAVRIERALCVHSGEWGWPPGKGCSVGLCRRNRVKRASWEGECQAGRTAVHRKDQSMGVWSISAGCEWFSHPWTLEGLHVRKGERGLDRSAELGHPGL